MGLFFFVAAEFIEGTAFGFGGAAGASVAAGQGTRGKVGGFGFGDVFVAGDRHGGTYAFGEGFAHHQHSFPAGVADTDGVAGFYFLGGFGVVVVDTDVPRFHFVGG